MTANTQKVVVDGITIETTDQGAQVISKLQGQLADAKSASDAAAASHAKEIAAKDAEIAKKDAAIDDLKSKVLDGGALDAAVAARADLLDKAARIAPNVKCSGLSDAAIRKAVVVERYGRDMESKSDAYIDARFDILVDEMSETADAQQALRTTISSASAVGDGRAAYLAALDNQVTSLNAHRQK